MGIALGIARCHTTAIGIVYHAACPRLGVGDPPPPPHPGLTPIAISGGGASGGWRTVIIPIRRLRHHGGYRCAPMPSFPRMLVVSLSTGFLPPVLTPDPCSGGNPASVVHRSRLLGDDRSETSHDVVIEASRQSCTSGTVMAPTTEPFGNRSCAWGLMP
jgi:hypothetical protein